jgi:hypothetical protein
MTKKGGSYRVGPDGTEVLEEATAPWTPPAAPAAAIPADPAVATPAPLPPPAPEPEEEHA